MARGYKPINLGDVGGLSNEEWLKCRFHGIKQVNGKPSNPVVHAEPGVEGYIPYTLGGSDVAVAAGVSNFSTPLQLYQKKKGIWTPPPPTNPDQLQMGHDFEEIAALWFSRKTGAKIINDTCMYQHPFYPWALADMDRRFILPDGRRGILEIKTTSFYCRNEWEEDSYPEKYEYQLRYYMGVDDCDLGAFICFWGMNPATDMALRWVERDEAKEDMIFNNIGQEFIDRLVNDNPPQMAGVDPKQAVEALAELYQGNKLLPTVWLGSSLETCIRKIINVDKQLEETKGIIKKLEAQRTAYIVPLVETMREHERGEFTDSNGNVFIIDYPSKMRTSIDTKALKQKYPKIAEELSKTSTSRSLKILSSSVR